MNTDIVRIVRLHLNENMATILPLRRIDVARYPNLHRIIPDNVLIIEEVFAEADYDILWDRFMPHLGKYGVFPILGMLGGNVVCIGYASRNAGFIYYYDFDFGLFELDTNMGDFINKLGSSSGDS